MHLSRFIVAACAAAAVAGIASGRQACPPDPQPTGLRRSPSDNISVIGEYAFAHSSTRLQARATQEKIAAGLFWNPAGSLSSGIPRAYGGFSSALIVNNPSPASAVDVEIEFRRQDGSIAGTPLQVTIPANGSHVMDASQLGQGGGSGFGSARIRVTSANSIGIVGATLHYFDSIGVPGWGIARDPDAIVPPVGPPTPTGPGEGSYQQLHSSEVGISPDTLPGALFGGPYRFTNMSTSDFENGAAPIFTIANPSDVAVTADLLVFASIPGVGPLNVLSDVLNFAPNGMVVYDRLWATMNQLALVVNQSYDFDLSVVVLPRQSSMKGAPVLSLVGDALVIDAFGDDVAGEQNRNLNLGRRMRMVSTAMATHPGLLGLREDVLACDISRVAGSNSTVPFIDTRVHVMNAGFIPTGSLTVEYFDHIGTRVGTDVVASGLLPAEGLHIGFGEPLTPNFPSQIFNGAVRVRPACGDDVVRLVGWTHREIGPTPSGWPQSYQFRKAYGEELDGPHGFEHGFPGFALPDYVMPLVRTWPFSDPPYWPGYTTFANLPRESSAPGNTGGHTYRFLEFDGFDATAPNPPVLGIPFGASSLTFEDSDPMPIGALSLLFVNQGNGSGRIDFAGAVSVVGINVLGDPFEEYRIGDFARKGFGPGAEFSEWMPIRPDESSDATAGP